VHTPQKTEALGTARFPGPRSFASSQTGPPLRRGAPRRPTPGAPAADRRGRRPAPAH
jgi:hypothetical protein